MFKRNARNALNQSAGIAPVQKFQTGGSVGAVTPFMGRGPTIQLNAAGPRSRRGTSLGGRAFIAPNRATTPGRAAELELARRALEGGLGSLSAGEQAMLGMSSGARSGGAFTQPLEDYLGDSALSSFVKGAGEIGGTIAGGVGGGITGLLSADEPDQGTVGGRLAGAVPDMDYLRSLGFEFPTQVYNQQPGPPPPPAAPTAASRPTSLGPGRFRQLTLPGSSSAGIPDGERAARERELERARAITAAGGTVDVDEVTGEIRPGPTDDIQQLINAAEKQRRTLESEGRMQQGQLGTETGTETTTSPTGSTAEQRTDTDPATDITVPQPKPENFSEIVAQAKAANAAQGVPEQDSAKSEIQTAVEKGTGSAEDLKAEFLKLLPKYEADPSVMGLNVALMGFTVASGKSANALENFSEGMKKTLPNFIKDAQAKKAFERETDLLASKYVIQRKEGDRTRGFSKNSYYAAEDFTAPDGREIVKGTHLRLNDNAFEAMGGAPLVDGATYRQIINDANELAKAKITASGKGKKGLDDYYMKSPVKKDLNQNVSVSIIYPTREGLALGLKPQLAGGDSEWTSATAGYVQDLEAMAFTDNALEDAIQLAEDGALGTPGLLGKLADSARGATEGTPMQGLLSKAGLDYGVVSAASEFENLNRIIALQSARIILNEGGKMISNQEREQVARSLGFADATYDKTTDTMNLGSWKNVFTNKNQAIDALRRVQTIIRNRAEEASKNYARIGSEVGYEIGGLTEAKATAPGARLQQGDDGIWDMVPSGGS